MRPIRWLPSRRSVLELALLSLAWLGFTALIGREFLMDRVPGWELLALWSTTLWGITAIGPSELLRSRQRWLQDEEQKRDDDGQC